MEQPGSEDSPGTRHQHPLRYDLKCMQALTSPSMKVEHHMTALRMGQAACLACQAYMCTSSQPVVKRLSSCLQRSPRLSQLQGGSLAEAPTTRSCGDLSTAARAWRVCNPTYGNACVQGFFGAEHGDFGAGHVQCVPVWA